MSYNSENTKVLATHTWENKERGGNVHMLLLHEKDDPHFPYEYVIGSYFTESIEYMEPFGQFPEGVIVDRSGTCFDVATGHEVGQANNSLSYQDPSYYEAVLADRKRKGRRIHYSWDWGHYFSDVVAAVEYWESEVLCKKSAKRMVLDDAWKRFGDTPIDEEENIDEPFWMKPGKSYPAGTSRFEIWNDFDNLYAEWGGVHALMFPSEH